MCMNCSWESFTRESADALADLDGIPEAGQGFAEGVRERIESMSSWASEHEHVTDKMETALENIRAGISRWLHD